MASVELVRYSAARKALAEAWKVDEVKTIRDKAMAMQVYAKQANDRSLIEQATDIRLRAEIRAGELLAEMKVRGERHKATGRLKGRNSQGSHVATVEAAPKLSDLGVTKTQSSRWQKLAALSRAEQEKVIAHAKQKADAAIERARANGKAKPTEDDEVGHEMPLSRPALELALAVRELVLAKARTMKPEDRDSLILALRYEVRDLRMLLEREFKKTGKS